jgi:hypothetical protein
MVTLIPFFQGFLFTIGAFVQVAWPALVLVLIARWMRGR